ncbi:hypothetical protein [Nesterenkonia rhizosphaerae]|uniref:DUF222 domain-containing protein n=1 Tax=Nesterenkonia rhizosphaerae TaxID=1348272 RepID=A0ABP9G496_9MICC
MSKTGGGRGTNQHKIKGTSQARSTITAAGESTIALDEQGTDPRSKPSEEAFQRRLKEMTGARPTMRARAVAQEMTDSEIRTTLRDRGMDQATKKFDAEAGRFVAMNREELVDSYVEHTAGDHQDSDGRPRELSEAEVRAAASWATRTAGMEEMFKSLTRRHAEHRSGQSLLAASQRLAAQGFSKQRLNASVHIDEEDFHSEVLTDLVRSMANDVKAGRESRIRNVGAALGTMSNSGYAVRSTKERWSFTTDSAMKIYRQNRDAFVEMEGREPTSKEEDQIMEEIRENWTEYYPNVKSPAPSPRLHREHYAMTHQSRFEEPWGSDDADNSFMERSPALGVEFDESASDSTIAALEAMESGKALTVDQAATAFHIASGGAPVRPRAARLSPQQRTQAETAIESRVLQACADWENGEDGTHTAALLEPFGGDTLSIRDQQTVVETIKAAPGEQAAHRLWGLAADAATAARA